MAVGCFGLGSVEIVGGSGSAMQLVQIIGSSGTIVAVVAKYSVAFPITYHYLGGLRHLYWDNKPDLLTNSKVATSSYYLFLSTALIASGAAIV
jgi:succinate dehydrogenase (ubiquinone) cytochrome b560 subunit